MVTDDEGEALVVLRVPARAMLDDALAPADLLVLGACVSTADPDGNVRAASRDLAAMLGRERSLVSRVLRRLVALGYLEPDDVGRGQRARLRLARKRGPRVPGPGTTGPRFEGTPPTLEAWRAQVGTRGPHNRGPRGPQSGPPPYTPPASPHFGGASPEADREPDLESVLARFRERGAVGP